MVKNRKQFKTKEFAGLLPEKNHSVPQQRENELFSKEEKYLLSQLAEARYKHDKRYELSNLTRLGTLYSKNGYSDKAIEYYEQAMKIDKENFYALDGLGMTYLNIREYDRAIEYFQLELNPVIAMNKISHAYRAKGDYNRAIEYAERVLKKDPENEIAMNELGINHLMMRNYAQSISWFERRLELEPRAKQAMNGLGITYREMEDYKRAIMWFKRILGMNPRDEQAMDGLGITYREMGDYEQAIMWFKRRLELEPRAKQAMDGLGITYRKMGDYEQAIKWFKQILGMNPRDEQAMNGLGITYREMREYKQAIMWYERLLESDPRNKQTIDGLGTTYREMHNYEQAIVWFDKLLKLYPYDEYAIINLARTYKEMDKISQAVELFKNRLRLSPNNSTIRFQLEKISDEYESTGKLKEAKDILNFLQQIQARSIFPTPRKETSLEFEYETRDEKLRHLEQATQRQDAELLQSRQMATLGVMASGLAHEINQPLQIILIVAQNCIREIQRNAIAKEGILADLEQVATNTKRIDRIVNHLRVLAQERKPKPEPVSVNTVIENSFIMFDQQLTKARGIRIVKNLLPDLPLVKADMVQLEEVFINLINNSREALEGYENKTIEISTQSQNGNILVKFQDNGKGIASEALPRIFDAFFTTKEKGLGLGLYIAQDIIQSYGGTIIAHSKVNEGTTFLIKLPIAEKEDSE